MADYPWDTKISRNGVSTMIQLARNVCKFVGKYGTFTLAERTSEDLASAMDAVRIACLAWEALDDRAGFIDRTADVDEPFDGVPGG
jgi:hypothetical protein